MIRYQLYVGQGRSSSPLISENTLPQQDSGLPERQGAESLSHTQVLPNITQNLRLIPTLFNTLVRPSVSHFFS